MCLCGCYANEALKQEGQLVISMDRGLLPLGQTILDAESVFSTA